MRIDPLKFRNPCGSGSAVNVSGGMSGIGDDIKQYVNELLIHPAAFKYGMYAVGAVFILFAFSGSSKGRR